MLFVVKLNWEFSSELLKEAKAALPLSILARGEEKGYFRVASVGHLFFYCRVYCRLSRRMQGDLCLTQEIHVI